MKIKGKEFLAERQKQIIEAFRVAGGEAITTAAWHVPVWTGMSRGSFLATVKSFPGYPKDSQTFFHSPLIPIVPVTEDRKRTYKATGELKTPELGARLSQYEISKENKGKSISYRFIFRSDVLQYQLNEFYSTAQLNPGWGGSRTAPWNSMEPAKRVFSNVLLRELKKLPSLFDYTEYQRISAGKGSGIQVKTIQGQYTRKMTNV